MIEKVFEILFGSRNSHSAERLTQGEKKLIFSCDSFMFMHASFSPVDSKKGLVQVSFSPEGRAEKYKERACLHAGKAVASSAEETCGCEFRAFCKKH